MPTLPPQFVCALLLIIFLIRLLRRGEGRSNPLLLITIAVYALQSILHGLRWGYDIQGLHLLEPFMASAIPPLTWVAFSAFTADQVETRARRRLWLHALPPVIVVAVQIAMPVLINPAIIATMLGYGVALVVLARRGPDALDRVQLDGAISVYRALQVTGFVMLASAVVDVAIAIDFIRAQGAHAAWIAGLAGVAFTVLLGFAAVVAGESAPVIDAPDTIPSAPPAAADSEADDAAVIAKLDALMWTTGLYRDPELSLDRLARRMVIPARRISAAINRARTMNVSQYVNDHRIADACRRLSASDASVTQIMFEVGFQTKSNFNREFLRVTGKSPSAWRAAHKAAPVET